MTRSVADVLVDLGKQSFEFFHDDALGAWAWDGADAFKLSSETFSQRIARDLYEQTGKVAARTTLKSAVTTLQGIAIFDGQTHPIGLRVAHVKDAVVVDLASERRDVVVITEDGWSIETSSPVRFHRPIGMQALPGPIPGGDLSALTRLWPVTGEDLVLVLAWVLAFFNPYGASPLLDLSGEQGSGKSLFAQMLRLLLDPNDVGLQTMPSDLRNLAVIASRHALPVFDNVSRITEEISDGLCRIASGSGFETRRLYTDEDLASFRARRPMLLTGIPELARAPDLSDRTICISLRALGDGARETEADVLAGFADARPALLGCIFDGVSAALGNLKSTHLREAPRMLDFARWAQAGSRPFGWAPEEFIDAYAANRRQGRAAVLDAAPVARYVRDLADAGFRGTPSQALAQMASHAGSEATRARGWPASPAGLASILRRLAPSLAEEGIEVAFEAGRIVSVTRLAQHPGTVTPIERARREQSR